MPGEYLTLLMLIPHENLLMPLFPLSHTSNTASTGGACYVCVAVLACIAFGCMLSSQGIL